MAAVRIFGMGDSGLSAFVDAPLLALAHEQDALAQRWPVTPGTLLDRLLHADPRPMGVFRLQDWMDGASHQASPLAGLVPPGSPLRVVDGLGVTFPVAEPCWGAAVLMRVGRSPAFGMQQREMLEHARPALTRLIRASGQRQGLISQAGFVMDASSSTPADDHGPVDRALARLTRTERMVLQYLRLGSTERQISSEIHRSQHTVHVHVKNIYRKLDVSSRRQLMERFGDLSSS